MKSSPPIYEYITLPDAARVLGISAPTLRKMAKERLISHKVFGTRIRFTREDIDNYLARSHRAADDEETTAI